MKTPEKSLITSNKIFIWILLIPGAALLIPLLAMRYNEDVNWSLSDIAIMWLLVFGLNSLYVVIARKLNNYRLALGVVLVLVFLYLWAELAVGVFTDLGS